jgi:hypothetical protein
MRTHSNIHGEGLLFEHCKGTSEQEWQIPRMGLFWSGVDTDTNGLKTLLFSNAVLVNKEFSYYISLVGTSMGTAHMLPR